jgi:asparagine synthase (glutamine-hydrolysing)
MCGIFALCNYEKKYSSNFITQQFKKGQMRGPETSQLCKVSQKLLFGFHRLAINGLNSSSDQPIFKGDIALICNGEIYNYKELYDLMNVDGTVIPTTQSDCEVIIWLYEKYGIEQTLQMLDGVFSFVLLDQRPNLTEGALMYIARDPYGVRPLYSIHQYSPYFEIESTIGFASELKVLSQFALEYPHLHYNVEQFAPGTYSTYVFSDEVSTEWKPIAKNTVYHRTGFCTLFNEFSPQTLETVIHNIQKYLVKAVEKRCSTTERPIACLLSGGLDSSLITALVSEYHKSRGLPPVETYSIGLADSVDLKYAKLVADHLGTKHTEIILTEADFCQAIPTVIKAIESYDTTTVRASIGNYLLGEYIAKHSNAKVIFNGDGSDELLGGYLYFKNAPDPIEFDKECRRLLKDIHKFDVLRSDKCISSHGLEPRTPFLDRTWTQYYLSISPQIRTFSGNTEKYWLRLAFSSQNYGKTPLLPDAVLWRKKEAFSDGVSGEHRSLYQILQEYCSEKAPLWENHTSYESMAKSDPIMKNVSNNLPKTAEQYYYRYVFETEYAGMGNVVPYFWMPKYIEATDASARTLPTYQYSACAGAEL